MTDSERQFALLNAAYLAKVYGGYRAGINALAIGFVSSADINAASSDSVIVDLANGCARPEPATISVSSSPVNGVLAIGSFTMADRNLTIPNGVTVTSLGRYSTVAQTFQMKIGREVSPTTFDVLATQPLAHSGSGWADVPLSFVIPLSGTFRPMSYTIPGYTNHNVQAAGGRAYKMGDLGVGTGYTGFTLDINGVPSLRASYISGFRNMTVVSPGLPLAVASSYGRALVEYDAVDAPALNTDLLAYVSCDGGTNFSPATLSSAGNGQNGRLVAETDDTLCAYPGTALVAKIVTIGKNVPIYAFAAQAH